MQFHRTQILAVLAALAVFFYGIWWFCLRETTLSANFKKVPLSQVIRFLEKKTGLEIKTNLDPSMTVSYFIYRASVGEALDTLALSADGRCQTLAVVAATRGEVDAYINGLVASQPLEGWKRHRVSLPGFALAGLPEVLPDPRAARLAVPPTWPVGGLQVHLQTLAESSDVVWVAPDAWDVAVAFNPGAVRVDQAVRAFLKAAKAEGKFLIFLRGGGRGGESRGGGEGPALAGGGEGWRGREMPDPAVIARRVEQQIASLPPDEQSAARENWEKERAQWEEIRNLPPDQRRAKIQEMMDNPQAQERIENSQADRDSRRSPERRRDRYRSYINRRAEARTP